MPNYKNSHTSYRLFTGPKHFSLQYCKIQKK